MKQSLTQRNVLNTYGIHKDSYGVNWLLQSNNPNAQCAFGLPSSDCEYVVDRSIKTCPHNFNIKNIAGDELLEKYLDVARQSELLKHLTPTYSIHQGILYVETSSPQETWYITELLGLYNPATYLYSSIRSLTDASLYPVFQSGLVKFIIGGMTLDKYHRIEDVINHIPQACGQVIIVGDKMPFYKNDGILKVIEYDPAVEEVIKRLDTLSELKLIGNRIVKETLLDIKLL